MKSVFNRSARDRSGQTMVEYIIIFCLMIGVAFALSALLSSLRNNGSRTLELVASEYP
ncbi:MAG: Flp family type IVb pilin [Kiritimatiellia bacterium]